MPMDPLNIKPIENIAFQTQPLKKSEADEANTAKPFGQWLQKSLSRVNAMQQSADTAAQQLVTGENKDIHGTMIAMQKANITFELVMEVRNKVISAYEEIKRMQF